MTTGKIVKIQARGVVVELEEEVEGFVPLSHLGRDNIKKPSDVFETGDEIPLKVIRIDPDARKILLSVKEYLADQDRGEVEEYMRKYGPRKTTVGEVVAAKDQTPGGAADAGGETSDEADDYAEGDDDGLEAADDDRGGMPDDLEAEQEEGFGGDETPDEGGDGFDR
jgi:small subunit ribosomal protein S1